MFYGGHHQRDQRPGTENVAATVGLGKAAELARAKLATDSPRVAQLRDRLESELESKIPFIRVNGKGARRTPNTTNLAFSYVEGESLVIALDLKGVACSTGAACSSGAVEPSHVLTAIGLPPEEARASLRFSLGAGNTSEDLEFALAVIPEVVEHLRELSPLYKKPATAR
jgi:cysteine desulfurase